MPTRYDIAYAAGLAAASPLIAARAKLRGKVAEALRERRGRVTVREGDARCVLVHGVSVGEINACRPLVDALHERDANLQVAVAATTQTGYARAAALFGEHTGHPAFATRFPIDTSGAIGRFLDALRPAAAVMMELEVWPNVTLACERRGIPLLVANGRITYANDPYDFEIALGATNLFNKFYYRNIFARGTFGGTGNLGQPAPPREWYLSVKKVF